ncbi:nudC domain-containing protein 2 isoform X3 [Pseudophryne corroboree]|uniref:nudC domain-containing protein 2 isoform X3 n=1 Tax=Pseudophryne corroboree TaxID=495146 RepID=UPI003081C84E
METPRSAAAGHPGVQQGRTGHSAPFPRWRLSLTSARAAVGKTEGRTDSRPLHNLAHFSEDKKLIRIVLTKCNRDAGNCWPSLLEDEYSADPWIQDEMQKKLTLERFQRENPGFDFSGADISGNYSKGGPDFSNLQK